MLRTATLLLVAALTLGAVAQDALRPGGDFTVEAAVDMPYSQPGPTLDAQQTRLFLQGRSLFHQRWVVAPSAFGLWGRGPVSNGEVCTDCHANNGRGRPPVDADEPLRSMVVRLSIPGRSAQGAPLAHPAYGNQLQFQGILGVVPGEGEAYLQWHETTVSFADGTRVQLRAPSVRFAALRFGDIDSATQLSLRLAPPVFGLGLLEAVPQQALLAIAERQQRYGIAGRPNLVWDVEAGRTVLGRFGLKASEPSLRQQIARAFIDELGVTSSLFSVENCTQWQYRCRQQPPGGNPELKAAQLDALEFYLRTLAVPARRNGQDAQLPLGERLFETAGCALCHVPTLATGAFPALPQLAHQAIHPYTDLLLHDLGEGLADGRPDFEAGARDWRTPPLWGLGLSEQVNGNAFLLHDGRARSLTEAILWHAGEALDSRHAFLRMSHAQREALVAFVLSL